MSKKNILVIAIFSFLGLAVISEIAYYYFTANQTPPLVSNSSPEQGPFIPQPLTSPLPTTKVPVDFDKIDYLTESLRYSIENKLIDSATLTTTYKLTLDEISYNPITHQGLSYQVQLIDHQNRRTLGYLPEDLLKIKVYLNSNGTQTPISLSDLIPGDILNIKEVSSFMLDNPTVESVTIYAER